LYVFRFAVPVYNELVGSGQVDLWFGWLPGNRFLSLNFGGIRDEYY